MLSDGFADELKEIISACPVARQTMLFSATMTDDVDALVRMSLRRPVRLFVDPKRSTARGLVQEFVRVRAEREKERAALLVALCKRTCKQGVLVFFRSKKLAHQMRVVFGILGMKAEEMHGDLTQDQVHRRFLFLSSFSVKLRVGCAKLLTMLSTCIASSGFAAVPRRCGRLPDGY